MNKYSRYSYILKNTVILVISADIISRHLHSPKKLIALTILFISILFNDYTRHKGYFLIKANRQTLYIISLIASMLGGSLLAFFAMGYSDIYMIILIYEIVFFTNDKVLKRLLSLDYFLMLGTLLIRQITHSKIISLASIGEDLMSILMFLLFIIMYTLFCLSTKAEMFEKAKTAKLNKELEESYAKLKDYSSRIKELTVEMERHRVAQELHDSLGHSLTAIIMHLDYIEKILFTDNDKAQKIIIKNQTLARNSIEQVRMAVYALKDNTTLQKGLLLSIKDMIASFEIDRGISIKYNLDENIENLSSYIKGIIYKVIQEGLTNGINHGKATEFIIKASFQQEHLLLIIKDNGIGCENINKGNGLLGIEKRVAIISGKVSFQSRIDEGFNIAISIPIKEESHEKDTIDAC